MDFQQLLESITPEIYESFKRAVSWASGRIHDRLAQSRKALCMQAIIAYEQRKPEEQRTGYVPPKTTACILTCRTTSRNEQPLKWQD